MRAVRRTEPERGNNSRKQDARRPSGFGAGGGVGRRLDGVIGAQGGGAQGGGAGVERSRGMRPRSSRTRHAVSIIETNLSREDAVAGVSSGRHWSRTDSAHVEHRATGTKDSRELPTASKTFKTFPDISWPSEGFLDLRRPSAGFQQLPMASKTFRGFPRTFKTPPDLARPSEGFPDLRRPSVCFQQLPRASKTFEGFSRSFQRLPRASGKRGKPLVGVSEGLAQAKEHAWKGFHDHDRGLPGSFDVLGVARS